MMAAEIRIDSAKLAQMQADAAGRDAWLRGIANQMLGDIVLSFGTSPDGRQYGVHVASQPGYPPNVDTGALRASLKVRKVAGLHYRIEDGVEYGIYLEDGTESIEARPFIRPVFDVWQQKIEGEVGGLIDE